MLWSVIDKHYGIWTFLKVDRWPIIFLINFIWTLLDNYPICQFYQIVFCIVKCTCVIHFQINSSSIRSPDFYALLIIMDVYLNLSYFSKKLQIKAYWNVFQAWCKRAIIKFKVHDIIISRKILKTLNLFSSRAKDNDHKKNQGRQPIIVQIHPYHHIIDVVQL